MPLYEYKCQKCEERTEVVRRFSDPPLTTCEACGGELKKLISSPAIQFKGSGFYITDYARGNSEAAKSESSAPGSSSQTDQPSGKSESKTETKSETKSDAGSSSSAETKSDRKSESKSDSGVAKGSD